MTTVRPALSHGGTHRVRAASPGGVRRHASRQRPLLRRRLGEEILSVLVLVFVLVVTLLLLGLEWLDSSPGAVSPASTSTPTFVVPGGTP